jgi:hypothetical protein
VKHLALVAVLGSLSGCDLLFQLEHLEPRGDAAVVGDASDANGDAGDASLELCPVGYVSVANAPVTSVYRYSSLAIDWNAAAVDCRDDSLTGISHLVVFEGVAEVAALRAFVPALAPWGAHAGYSRDTIAHGGVATQFTSVTGMPLSSTSPLWASLEPDNGGGGGPEEAGTFFANDRNLVDAPIAEVRGYVCECDHIVANQVFQNTD